MPSSEGNQRNLIMKTFKIFYKWRVDRGQANTHMESNFSFEKADTELQAIEQFKSEFRNDVEFVITSIVEC